jgi:hypothetical protein
MPEKPSLVPETVRETLKDHTTREAPYPILFATISGAHLYGFPSEDSDYDLRGVHLLPAREVVGLKSQRDTIELSGGRDAIELDLVTHDLLKFALLMLKNNGYVLEQLFSPLVVHTSPVHEELKHLGEGCITRFHAHHYLGFSSTQWKLFEKDSAPRAKPLLYVYRVLLTGIHLMRSGRIEANLRVLNDEFHLPGIDELIEAKVTGGESYRLTDGDLAFHRKMYERLVSELEQARDVSMLPDKASARDALSDLVVRLRLETVG